MKFCRPKLFMPIRKISFFLLLLNEGNYLYCSSFAIQAGIAPIIWQGRNDFQAVSCNAINLFDADSPVVTLFKIPAFNKFFKHPWTIGLFYFQENCAFNWYINANFRQGNPKTLILPRINVADIDTIFFSLTPASKYRAFDFYAGVNYTYDPCSCYLIVFGAQFGFAVKRKVNFNFTTNSLTVIPPEPFVSDQLPFFKSSLAPAGGLLCAVLFELWCNWSFNITGQILVTCGSRLPDLLSFSFDTQSIMINPFLAPNAFKNNGISTEIIFPITVGLGYSF